MFRIVAIGKQEPHMKSTGRGKLSLLASVAALTTAAILSFTGPVVSQQPAAPTFTKDIAPIFQEKCQSCHRPGYIAPMSLVTYEEARPWAKAIKERVLTR